MTPLPEMTASSLVELLQMLDAAGIECWLDGGWGVDALLGRQTRPHKDVDLIVRVADVPSLVEVLAGKGFAFRSPAAQVLCHAHGYTPTDKDRQDMQLLEASFGVQLPPQLKPRPD